MVCLSGGPRRRGSEKGECERLMIGKKGKFTGFKEETEMVDYGISCEEFYVKGGVFGFGGG